jgi:hypothetical protein
VGHLATLLTAFDVDVIGLNRTLQHHAPLPATLIQGFLHDAGHPQGRFVGHPISGWIWLMGRPLSKSRSR